MFIFVVRCSYFNTLANLPIEEFSLSTDYRKMTERTNNSR